MQDITNDNERTSTKLGSQIANKYLQSGKIVDLQFKEVLIIQWRFNEDYERDSKCQN